MRCRTQHGTSSKIEFQFWRRHLIFLEKIATRGQSSRTTCVSLTVSERIYRTQPLFQMLNFANLKIVTVFQALSLMEWPAFSHWQRHQSIAVYSLIRRVLLIFLVACISYWCGNVDWATNWTEFTNAVRPVIQEWIDFLTPLVGPGRSGATMSMYTEARFGARWNPPIQRPVEVRTGLRINPPVTAGRLQDQ